MMSVKLHHYTFTMLKQWQLTLVIRWHSSAIKFSKFYHWHRHTPFPTYVTNGLQWWSKL